MTNKQEVAFIKAVTAITFVIMIVVNVLAEVLPINGVSTGAVSDAYQNLFTPAGITFAIWGLIYVLLAAFTLYQIGFFQRDKSEEKTELLKRVGAYFSISSIANAAWIFAWHYGLIAQSMVLMVIILVCLILIVTNINKAELSTREKLFVKIPFSIYFGWITVATIANFTVLLVSLGWNRFSLSEQFWAIVVIIIGFIIGALTTLKNKDIAYGLVIIWAYWGILIKHLSASGFHAQYHLIIITVIICIALLLFVVAYVLAGKRLARKKSMFLR